MEKELLTKEAHELTPKELEESRIAEIKQLRKSNDLSRKSDFALERINHELEVGLFKSNKNLEKALADNKKLEEVNKYNEGFIQRTGNGWSKDKLKIDKLEKEIKKLRNGFNEIYCGIKNDDELEGKDITRMITKAIAILKPNREEK